MKIQKRILGVYIPSSMLFVHQFKQKVQTLLKKIDKSPNPSEPSKVSIKLTLFMQLQSVEMRMDTWWETFETLKLLICSWQVKARSPDGINS